MNRPQEPGFFQYAPQYGVVHRVSQEAWEVDVLMANGGLVQGAVIIGPRLPEVTSEDRPQYVMVGWFDANQAQPFAIPISSRLGSTRNPRRAYRYYEEWGNYRVSESTDGTLEIENARDASRMTIRISEGTDDVEIEGTGGAKVRLRLGLDGKVSLEADTTVEVKCDDIKLGDPAIEAAVHGNTLESFYNLMKLAFDEHTHGGSNPPNGPFPTWIPQILSEVVKVK